MSTTSVRNTPTQQEARPAFRHLRRGHVITGVLLLVLLIVVALTAFGSPLWQLLGTGMFLLSLAVVVLLSLGVLLFTVLMAAITRKRKRIQPWTQRLLHLFLVLVVLMVAVTAATLGSQWHASTPPILGANGQPLPGSIATMEQVTLNGSQQWITIRGKNILNPVLLFLAGGPGAGGLPWTPMMLAPLEDHFVVVNWDQPNTGKSYGSVPLAQLTAQRYVSDAYALTQMLRTRLHQDKIYVFGSSWGSILGIMLVQQHPDLFHAYIGSGQMVNTTENDIMGYQIALTYAGEHSDTNTVEALRHNGPPPYVGDGMAWKYLAYLNVLNSYMGESDYRLSLLIAPQLAPEYGLLNRVNWERGLYETFTVVYPQLQHLDFTTQAARLDVPVYFLEGRMDVNAMASLVEHYYTVLQAPHKELIWSKSGHGGMDSNQFVDVMVNRVLAQTYN